MEEKIDKSPKAHTDVDDIEPADSRKGESGFGFGDSGRASDSSAGGKDGEFSGGGVCRGTVLHSLQDVGR